MKAFDRQTLPPEGMQHCGNFSITPAVFQEGTEMRSSSSNVLGLSGREIAGMLITVILLIINTVYY